jgi:outer membrane murein-binding lipoprotein Lpp
MFGRGEIMAGTPTEVLNDDIKELKSDIRENRTKIDLVKDEVQRSAVAQAQMRAELREDNHRIALSQAEMKGEFRMVKLLLSLMLAGIAGAVWQFYGLNGKVNGIEVKVNGLEAKVNGIEAKVNGIEAKMSGIEARFDKADSRSERLESAVAKILEQTRPSAPPKASATTP